MTFVGEEKPTLQAALEHYGKKGMKWGIIRETVSTHASYSKAQMALDKEEHGTSGVRRINNRMVVDGKSHEESVAAEKRFVRNRRLAIAGAYFAVNWGPMLVSAAGGAANSAATKYVAGKTAKAGAKLAADLLSDSRGIGAQKVVNVAFNAAKGVWE